MEDKYLFIIKQLEGFRATPYKCSAGVWTIGYGHSQALDNRALQNKPITEEEATALLKKDLSMFESIVKSNVKVPLTDDQRAALTFFCFNVGATAFKKSTLLKKLNNGDYDSVPSELLRWTKVSGKESVGLARRRHKEIELWLSNAPIKEEPTPKALPHKDMKLPHKEFTVHASTVVIGLLADKTGNGVLQWVFGILIIILFIYCFIKYRHKLDNLW